MALRFAVDLVKVDYALHTMICCLKFREVFNTLVVANKDHRIKRIFEVLRHELLLNLGTALVDEVEWNFK